MSCPERIALINFLKSVGNGKHPEKAQSAKHENKHEHEEESETDESSEEYEDRIPLGRSIDDALPYDIFNRLIGGYLIQWHRGPEDKP